MNIMSSSKQESSSFGFWKPLTHVDSLPFFAVLSLLSNCPVCPNAFMLARSLWNCRQNNPSKHYNKPTCLHAAEILGCEEIQDLSEELEAVLHVSLD
jgi:hypothetical protein